MRITAQFLLAVCATLFDFTTAASTFSPTRPPALPLSVKSPYLNTLQFAGGDGGNGGYLAGQWPQFWAYAKKNSFGFETDTDFDSGQIVGWAGIIRVDGTPYTWMGAPNGPALVTQTAFEYTSTRSVFTMDVAGKVEMNITFMSPVTPSDQKRQSLIFSYLDVAVESVDGMSHNVQLYTDISAGMSILSN